MKAPQSRLQPPQAAKVAPAATVAASPSKIAPPSSSGKMLKLKFFGGKDKDKASTPPIVRSDAADDSNRTSNSSSGVSSTHSDSLDRSAGSSSSPRSSLKALAKRGLKAPSKSPAKSGLIRPKEFSGKVRLTRHHVARYYLTERNQLLFVGDRSRSTDQSAAVTKTASIGQQQAAAQSRVEEQRRDGCRFGLCRFR